MIDRLLVAIAGSAFLALSTADAAVLVEVDGPVDQAVVFGPGEGLGFAFTLTQEVHDVSIDALVDCTSCSGLVTLNKDGFGPTASPSQTIAAATFGPGTTNSFLSGESEPILPLIEVLAPGDYFVLVSIDEGQGTFFSSSSSTLSEGLGSDFAYDLVVDDIRDGFPAGSDWRVRLERDELLLSVSGSPAGDPIPLPPGTLLMALPLAVMLRLRRS